jgi:hypothetical protein
MTHVGPVRALHHLRALHHAVNTVVNQMSRKCHVTRHLDLRSAVTFVSVCHALWQANLRAPHATCMRVTPHRHAVATPHHNTPPTQGHHHVLECRHAPSAPQALVQAQQLLPRAVNYSARESD